MIPRGKLIDIGFRIVSSSERSSDFRAPKDRNVRNAFEETLSTLFIRRFHRDERKKRIIDLFRAIGILALQLARSWLLEARNEVLRKADKFHALREA